MDLIVRLLLRGLIPLIGKPFVEGDYAFSEWWRRQRSNGWPVVTGHVHSTRAYYDDHLWQTEVSYSYTVSGEYYSGFSGRHFARERDADEYLGRFPMGVALFVRHKPARPEISLLRQDDQMGLVAYGER